MAGCFSVGVVDVKTTRWREEILGKIVHAESEPEEVELVEENDDAAAVALANAPGRGLDST